MDEKGWMDGWADGSVWTDGYCTRAQVLRLDEIQMHSPAPTISTNELILPPARFYYRASLFMPAAAHLGTRHLATQSYVARYFVLYPVLVALLRS